ncbi:MAG: APC family permease [Bryobacteraceae bacterium]|nr:APC family permease [Bryobacteraceae bacterium]
MRRELGLRDLTLFAVTTIVGTRWIPAAAHAGPGSLTLWVLSAVFFVIPLAMAVGALTVRYPGTGGLYLWSRSDFGPWHGFLCFWIYWTGMACWFPGAAMFYMSAALHALGPSWAQIASNRTAVVVASLMAIWIALGTNLFGLRIGKWTQNAGGAAAWLLCLSLAFLALLAYAKRGSATMIDLMPALDLSTLSFSASIAYAMSGLELAGMMGGEIRDPGKTLPRAGWIASGVVTIFYCGSTLALLVLMRPENISELYGLAQAGKAGAEVTGAHWVSPALAGLVLLSALGQFGGIGTAVSRMPFAAGVDKLLPESFGKVHPRWATPYVSILTLGIVSSILLIVMQLGDSMAAGYQAIVSLMLLAGFVPFIYIFLSAWKAGKRVSAVSGLVVTVVAVGCSLVPTSEIRNVWVFEGKLALGTLATVVTGWLVYRRNKTY